MTISGINRKLESGAKVARTDTVANREGVAKLGFILDLLADEIEINKRLRKTTNFENQVALLTLKSVLRQWRRDARN